MSRLVLPISQTAVDEELQGEGDAPRKGLCSYTPTLVPRMWLTTQRRNHRLFQHRTVLEIAEEILDEHDIGVQRQVVEPHEPHRLRSRRSAAVTTTAGAEPRGNSWRPSTSRA